MKKPKYKITILPDPSAHTLGWGLLRMQAWVEKHWRHRIPTWVPVMVSRDNRCLGYLVH